VDSEDDFRHSKWLSFMNKRLRIARRLLSDNGVIFISIDDNEQASLKLLCDEIFGEKNFVANIIWQKKTGAADARGIAVITEYIMIYVKNETYINDIFAKNTEAFDEKRYRYSDQYKERGPFYYDSLDRGSVRYSDSLNYAIIAPDGTTLYPNDRTTFVNDGWTWKWSKEKVKWGIENGFIDIAKNNKKKSGWSVRYKIYLNVDNEGNLIKKNVPFKNMITDTLNADAANDIKNIFDSKVFSFPKPVKLLHQLLKYIDKSTLTILDFFAGSGTTMHAVMQLNNEDGGKRQCILVTNNENGICENITYERNRRVIQGYTNSKGERVEGLSNNNLRYYQTNYVPRERTQRNMRSLVNAATDLLCIQNNLYEEQDFLIDGKKVSKSIARYFGEMLVVYREEYAEEIARAIEGMEIKGKKLKVYIFSPGRYAFDDTFIDVQDKIELVALPAAIYDAYKHVLPKRREKLFEEPQSSIPTDLFSEL
jgi:adenine-specific DNA-methyltransferase